MVEEVHQIQQKIWHLDTHACTHNGELKAPNYIFMTVSMANAWANKCLISLSSTSCSQHGMTYILFLSISIMLNMFWKVERGRMLASFFKFFLTALHHISSSSVLSTEQSNIWPACMKCNGTTAYNYMHSVDGMI